MKEFLQDGLYDEILSRKKKRAIESEEIQSYLDEIDAAEFSEYLALYIERILRIVVDDFSENSRVEEGLKLCDSLIKTIFDFSKLIDTDDFPTDKILKSLIRKNNQVLDDSVDEIEHPGIPLSQSALLVNARDEFRIGTEIKKEIKSANRIDFICSFIKWSGLRLIKEQLKERINRGIDVRVITTVYMGASDKRAIDELKKMGAQVKVSYDTRRTRLHAKAWCFHRNSGYTTAYVGSSNLSAAAQTEGVEWNVRISKVESPHLIDKFEASFESYWNSEEFKTYNGSIFEQEALSKALKKELIPDFEQTFFDIKPYSFQEEILNKLSLERQIKKSDKNLVVAATGTGKTVISAFDYKNYKKEVEETPTLLFVAHRKEILKQSIQTFRQVLKNANFGEMLVDNYQPHEWNHVFASIQSLNSQQFNFESEKYDVVIIDEFHHAEAATYQKLLNHINPKYLLGLTATPERSDGVNIKDWFNGRATAELRVWNAIDSGLLSPFQYFGVHDNTDLKNIGWSRGRYDIKELEQLYTESEERLAFIEKELWEKVKEPLKMKALGFCVSVQHAQFMAEKFNQMNIPGIALSGNSERDERSGAISKLRNGKFNAIFTVDLFNEGVDIPEVDTILFLRPTDSATLFTQQLGRGLRLSEGKECLTVLDFIGHSNEKFNFANKFKALTNLHGRKLLRHIKSDFPVLPTGCAVQLDKVSQDIVLDNVRQSIANTKGKILSDFVGVERPNSLVEFLQKTELKLEDLYRNDFYFTQLKRNAGLIDFEQTKEERKFGRSIIRSIHIDSLKRLKWSIAFFSNLTVPKIENLTQEQSRFLKMWAANFGEADEIQNVNGLLKRFWKHSALVKEYFELCSYLIDRITHKLIPWENKFSIPLEIHARYSRDETVAAFGDIRKGRLFQPREGVYFNKKTKCNLLFVTLNKSEKDYSPSTMYRDYAISESLFHWQTQSNTDPKGIKGKRHIKHKEKGIRPLLFVRNNRKDERGQTEPYYFLGPVDLEKWEGSQPMNIVWRVEEPIPADIYKESAINFY